MNNNLKAFLGQIRENGGASYSLNTGFPKSGIFASYQANEFIIGAERSEADVEKSLGLFIRMNSDKLSEIENHIGGWINEGKLYFDVSRRFDNIEEAAYFGILNGQLAIYSFKHGEIALPKGQIGTGKQADTYARMKAQEIAATYS